jgi:hypothetical protein
VPGDSALGESPLLAIGRCWLLASDWRAGGRWRWRVARVTQLRLPTIYSNSPNPIPERQLGIAVLREMPKAKTGGGAVCRQALAFAQAHALLCSLRQLSSYQLPVNAQGRCQCGRRWLLLNDMPTHAQKKQRSARITSYKMGQIRGFWPL